MIEQIVIIYIITSKLNCLFCCVPPISVNLRIAGVTEKVVACTINFFTNAASLLPSVIHPWSNLWLVGSIILTMLLHVAVLYIEPLAALFSVSFFILVWSSVLYVKSNWDNRGTLVQVSPLSWAEWKIVLYLSFPVILIDEVLKLFSRSPRGRRFPLRLWRRDILPKESRDN